MPIGSRGGMITRLGRHNPFNFSLSRIETMIRLLLCLAVFATCCGCSSGVGFGFFSKQPQPTLVKPPTQPPLTPYDYYQSPRY
jgi:hypothetical protein